MRSVLEHDDDVADGRRRGGWRARTQRLLSSLRKWNPSARVVIVACVTAAVGLLTGLLAWSLASPYGTTPDEDFHMISAWCPRPGQGGCEIVGTAASGLPVIAIPAAFVARVCYLDHTDASTACGLAVSEHMVWSTRANRDSYPRYYYQTMHILASNDVQQMTLHVRLANSAIAAMLALVVLLLVNASARRVYVWTLAATAVVGVPWLVASAAPDGWAIVGTATVWAAVTGAFFAEVRWRRLGLLAIGIIGGLQAVAARSDAGVWIGIAAVVPCIINWRRLRRDWDISAAAIIVAAIGAAGLASTTQVRGMFDSGCGVRCPGTPNTQSALHLLVNNVVFFPEWFSDAWRRTFDMQQPQIAALASFGCLIVIVGAGLSRGGMTAGKLAALLVAIGSAVGAPIVSLQIGHSLLALSQGGLAPRYILPLFIIAVGVALTPVAGRTGRYLSLRATVILWAVISTVQAVYLHQWIRRCVTGLSIKGFNLTPGAQWWWPSGPSPMTVWVVGGLGFIVASSAVVFVWWYPRNDSETQSPGLVALGGIERPDPAVDRSSGDPLSASPRESRDQARIGEGRTRSPEASVRPIGPTSKNRLQAEGLPTPTGQTGRPDRSEPVARQQ